VVIPIRDDNPTSRRAIVTLLLLVVNIVVFAVVQPHDTGGIEETRFTYEHAAIPCELRQRSPLTVAEYQADRCGVNFGDTRPIFPDKNVWLAVLVSMFLHGSWLHVLGNMLFLWVFGNNVEDYLGRFGYVAFYLFAGLVAAATYILSNPDSITPVLGASGAIAGVMGMYLVLWPRARVTSFVPIFIFFVVSLPAALVLLTWFGLQFLTDPNSGVAWVAHVGGFVVGALVGLALRVLKPPRPPIPRRAF
jgi:membrane associated rhomboid family serine protease